MRLFGPVVTAMITPFTPKGEVNYDLALEIADHLINTGTTAILLTGTTGESPTLTHEEEFHLYDVMVKNLGKRVHIMAGTGSNATRTAIEGTQKAEALGVQSSLQVVPYYNKPCQEGLFQHFKAVAENTSLPIMLYNIPGRTGVNMLPETVARLSQIKNIVAIKEAAGSVDQVKAIRKITAPEFMIYSGDDALTLPFMNEGAVGVVSVASHVAGKEIRHMVELQRDGKKAEAKAIHDRLMPLFEALFLSPNPTPVKAALTLMGFPVGKPRLPLVPAPETVVETLKKILETLK